MMMMMMMMMMIMMMMMWMWMWMLIELAMKQESTQIIINSYYRSYKNLAPCLTPSQKSSGYSAMIHDLILTEERENRSYPSWVGDGDLVSVSLRHPKRNTAEKKMTKKKTHGCWKNTSRFVGICNFNVAITSTFHLTNFQLCLVLGYRACGTPSNSKKKLLQPSLEPFRKTSTWGLAMAPISGM